jgi:hypothetical protein
MSAGHAYGAQAVGPGTAWETACHGGHGRHGAGHVQRRGSLVTVTVTSPVTTFTAPVARRGRQRGNG